MKMRRGLCDLTDSEFDAMVESMKKSICSKVFLEAKGIDRYLIHTGFTFQDGDELHIVLKKRDGKWIITDDAHTLMWLSHEDFNLSDTRKAILEVTLSSNNVSFEDGRIYIDCTGKDMGQCFMSMIQAILQTADTLYPTSDRVQTVRYSWTVPQAVRENMQELRKIRIAAEEISPPVTATASSLNRYKSAARFKPHNILFPCAIPPSERRSHYRTCSGIPFYPSPSIARIE